MRKISIILFLNVLTFLNINSYGALDASVLEKIKLMNTEENQKDGYREITLKRIIN